MRKVGEEAGHPFGVDEDPLVGGLPGGLALCQVEVRGTVEQNQLGEGFPRSASWVAHRRCIWRGACYKPRPAHGPVAQLDRAAVS
jgi:hypothetical protein